MKKIGVIVLSLFLLGCTLESQFSLPRDTDIQTEFLGAWQDKNGDVLKIEGVDKTTYRLIYITNGKEDKPVMAFASTIKGHLILNLLYELEGNVTYSFYKVEVKDDTLTYFEVNDDLVDSDFDSAEELMQFFETHINDSNFFESPLQLKRK